MILATAAAAASDEPSANRYPDDLVDLVLIFDALVDAIRSWWSGRYSLLLLLF